MTTPTLPADIEAAIEAFSFAARDWGVETSKKTGFSPSAAWTAYTSVAQARATLDAAILAHLEKGEGRHAAAESDAGAYEYRVYQLEDEIARLKAEIAHLGGGGWRTIDSAPRDGTPVLVGWDHSGWEPTKAHYDDRCWGVLTRKFELDELQPPTHWQPLPAPPSPDLGRSALAEAGRTKEG